MNQIIDRLVYGDTETTSLRWDKRAWDIGLIVRAPGEADVEHQWFIDKQDLDLGNADPYSLSHFGFYDRHPQYCGHGEVAREADVMAEVEALIRGAHIVCSVPDFDVDVLRRRMRKHGICPSMHYHLICAEVLAAGFLAGIGKQVPVPWTSEDLYRGLGINPDGFELHTAIGDARLARAVFDAAWPNW